MNETAGGAETTGAVERAAEAILDRCYGQELPEAPIDLARAALVAALDETELAAVVRGALQLTESQQATSAARDAYVAHAVRMHVIGGAA